MRWHVTTNCGRIVNRAQHCVCPQDLTLATPPSTLNSNIDALGDVDAEGDWDEVGSQDWTILFPSIQFEANELDFTNNPLQPAFPVLLEGRSLTQSRVGGLPSRPCPPACEDLHWGHLLPFVSGVLLRVNQSFNKLRLHLFVNYTHLL